MKNIFKSVSFTKSEIQIIVFVISVLTAGFTLKYYKQVIENGSGTPFDFSKTDNEFRKLSGNINKINSGKLSDSLKSSDSSEIDDTELTELLISSEDSVIKAEKNKQKEIVTDPGIEIININTASAEELTDLPGVGESTAAKIISYREEKKGFKKPEDIMNVKGIGKKKFEKLKGYIKTQ